MPKRDIESLGVMGWGLEAARKFFRRRRRRPNFTKSIHLRNQVVYDINPFTKSNTLRNEFVYIHL